MAEMQPLQGIIPYVVTPVHADGSVNLPVFIDQIRYLLDEGVQGICVLGSSGEFPYLSESQCETLVACAVQEVAGRVPVIAGVSGFSTHVMQKAARRYAELGADALVIMPNQYFPLKQESLVSLYGELATVVHPLPIVLYTNPKYMHFDLSLELLEKIAVHDNILYLKDASGNTGKLLSIINRFGDRFSIFSASAHIPFFIFLLGGVGWMSGPSCLIPKQSLRLYNLYVSGKWQEGLLLQKQLWELNRVFAAYDLVACIKAGLEHLGFPVGNPISPTQPLKTSEREEVCRIIDAVRAL